MHKTVGIIHKFQSSLATIWRLDCRCGPAKKKESDEKGGIGDERGSITDKVQVQLPIRSFKFCVSSGNIFISISDLYPATAKEKRRGKDEEV